MRRIACAALLLCAFASPAGLAYAQDNAAVDEYTEAIPDPDGDRPTSDPRDPVPLPGPVAEELESLGEGGARAAAIAELTDPGARHDGGKGHDTGGGGIGAVIDAATGSPDSEGMGVVLPIILIAALAGAVGTALLRRRATPAE